MEEQSTNIVQMDSDVSVTGVSEGSSEFVRIKQEVDLPEDDTYYPMDFGISVEDEEEMNPVYIKMKSKEPGSTENANIKSTAVRERPRSSKAKSGSVLRRGRSKTRARSSQPTSPGPELEHAEGCESSEDDYADSYRGKDSHEANDDTHRKKHKVFSDLTNEMEESMVEWIRETDCLYNKKRMDYRDFQMKDKLWADKAKELGKKVNILKVWYKSIRTRYVKLARKQSNFGTAEWTERDHWVMEKFSFLAKHIGKVRRNMRSQRLPPKLKATANSHTGSTSAAAVRHQVNDAEEPDGMEQPTPSDHMDLPPPPPPPPPLILGPDFVPDPGPSSIDGSKGGLRGGPVTRTVPSVVEVEAVVPGITQRYEQFIQMQERVLMSVVQPRVVTERTAFADWLKTVTEGFDRSVWRDFQFECFQLIHKYQCRNDQVLSDQSNQPSTS